MNPKHYQLRTNPEDGAIWLVLAKPGQPLKRIRDMTNELMMCLCADISRALDEDDQVQSLNRSVRFADGMVCEVKVFMTALPESMRSKPKEK